MRLSVVLVNRITELKLPQKHMKGTLIRGSFVYDEVQFILQQEL
jgi:hypothetical protein